MKRVANTVIDDTAKKLKSSDNAFIKFLESTGEITWEEFEANYFEQRPLVLRKLNSFASPTSFSKEQLLANILPNEKLTYEDHMRVVKYSNSERETLSHEYEEVANASTVKSYFDSGYSVQFYQPQRYNDHLYSLLSAFESKFGVLAGSSAYLTPAKTQALAPHHDDVEVFILQTEGSKH